MPEKRKPLVGASGGGAKGSRTLDLRIANAALWPAELSPQSGAKMRCALYTSNAVGRSAGDHARITGIAHLHAVKRILILNGPNLDLLGSREPAIYGSRSYEDFLVELRSAFVGIAISHQQSNSESDLVTGLRQAAGEVDAVVLNAAGYSHTSVALRDTIAAIAIPVVEVHISNIHAREEFRHNTITGGACTGVISGFGLEGYRMAVEHLLRRGV